MSDLVERVARGFDPQEWAQTDACEIAGCRACAELREVSRKKARAAIREVAEWLDTKDGGWNVDAANSLLNQLEETK